MLLSELRTKLLSDEIPEDSQFPILRLEDLPDQTGWLGIVRDVQNVDGRWVLIIDDVANHGTGNPEEAPLGMSNMEIVEATDHLLAEEDAAVYGYCAGNAGRNLWPLDAVVVDSVNQGGMGYPAAILLFRGGTALSDDENEQMLDHICKDEQERYYYCASREDNMTL